MTDDLEVCRSGSVCETENDVSATVCFEAPDLVGENIVAELALQRNVRCPERNKDLIYGRDCIGWQKADGTFQDIPSVIHGSDRVRRDEKERATAFARAGCDEYVRASTRVCVTFQHNNSSLKF